MWAKTDNDTQEKAEDTAKLNFMESDDLRIWLVEKQENGRQGVPGGQTYIFRINLISLQSYFTNKRLLKHLILKWL